MFFRTLQYVVFVSPNCPTGVFLFSNLTELLYDHVVKGFYSRVMAVGRDIRDPRLIQWCAGATTADATESTRLSAVLRGRKYVLLQLGKHHELFNVGCRQGIAIRFFDSSFERNCVRSKNTICVPKERRDVRRIQMPRRFFQFSVFVNDNVRDLCRLRNNGRALG